MVKKLNELLKLNAEQQARTDFVSAASGLMMADGQSQDPMRAQVRFRNGDMVYVKDLPVIDRKNPQPNGDYVVALVADHEGKTKVQAGGLWLFVENGKLHALVLWSKNKVAADLKPLADDRVLQFSTEGYVDEIGEDGKYGDFWIHTLSPVTVGNDPGTEVLNDIKLDGRILVRNALRFDNRGEEMPASKKPAAKKPAAKKENEITPEEEQVIVDRVTEQVLAAMQEGDTENDAIDPDDIEEEDDVEGEEGDDNQDDDAADDADDDAEEEEEETVPAKNKLSTTPKSPKANARPKQPIAKVSEKRGEQEEIVAFSNALAQAARDGSGVAGVRACMNVYNSKVKKKHHCRWQR
jgi:hypothetical protein